VRRYERGLSCPPGVLAVDRVARSGRCKPEIDPEQTLDLGGPND